MSRRSKGGADDPQAFEIGDAVVWRNGPAMWRNGVYVGEQRTRWGTLALVKVGSRAEPLVVAIHELTKGDPCPE